MTELSINSILHEMQIQLKAPKSQWNSFSQFYYRSIDDIFIGIKEILPENCSITLSDEVKQIGDRYYVVATASFWCGKEHISVNAWAREALEKKSFDLAQITTSASSTARKAALCGLFAIDDEKTPEQTTNQQNKGNSQQNRTSHKSGGQPNSGYNQALTKEQETIVMTIKLYFQELDVQGCRTYYASHTRDNQRAIWRHLPKDQQDWIKKITSKRAPEEYANV